jgi:hypothetical protein
MVPKTQLADRASGGDGRWSERPIPEICTLVLWWILIYDGTASSEHACKISTPTALDLITPRAAFGAVTTEALLVTDSANSGDGKVENENKQE